MPNQRDVQSMKRIILGGRLLLIGSILLGGCRRGSLSAEEQQAICGQAIDAVERYHGDSTELRKSLVALQGVVRANPRNAEAYGSMGRVAGTLSFPLDQVLAFSAKALEIDPDNMTAIINRAYGLLGENDLPGAKSMLERAENIDPAGVRTHLLHAMLAAADGRSEDAIATAKDAYQQSDKLYNKEFALNVMNGIAGAPADRQWVEAAYEGLIAAHPDVAWLKGNYGYYLNTVHEQDRAIDWLRKTLAQSDYQAAHNALSGAYYMKGYDLLWKKKQFQEAKRYFVLAIQESPTHYYAYYNLAMCERALDHLPASEEALRKALSIQPDFALAKTELDKHLRYAGENPKPPQWLGKLAAPPEQ